MVLGRLAVIPGHSPKAQGVTAIDPLNRTEFTYGSAIATTMLTYAPDYEIEAQIFYRIPDLETAYMEVNDWLSDGMTPGACLELHFNAATPEARGTETLYDPNTPESARWASLVQGTVCVTFSRSGKLNRGVKRLAVGDRGHHNLELSKYPACIIEPFFGTNSDDAKLGVEKQLEYAECLCIAAKLFFRNA